MHVFGEQMRKLSYVVRVIQCRAYEGVTRHKGVTMARVNYYHQPEGIANANIFDLSAWEAWDPSVTPNAGDKSMPRIFGFDSGGPPTGVAGEPEDAGEVVCEKLGEGVSGVLGSEPQEPLVGVPGPLWVKPGTGLDVDDCSCKGVLDVDASALAARLDTNDVG